MVKMEVKSTIIISAPGKNNCRKFPVPVAPFCNDVPNPAPITTQNSSGETTTPTTRAGWR